MSLREDVQVSNHIDKRVRMVTRPRRERMVAHDIAYATFLLGVMVRLWPNVSPIDGRKPRVFCGVEKPWFSTFNSWEPVSSDESPCRTIPIGF